MRLDHLAIDARARGLAQHLCNRAQLLQWAGLSDLTALGQALQVALRFDPPLPPQPQAADIDQAGRRRASAMLATLARWAEPEHPLLVMVEAEQARRSLRALLRGAAQAAAPAARLAGLMPTRRLPPALLDELAQAPTPHAVAQRLAVFRDPDAAAILELTRSARVDLLALEQLLARGLAERWQQAARRGDAALRETVQERIDLVNVEAAWQQAGSPIDPEAARLFIEGGRCLDRQAYSVAAGAASRADARRTLAQALAGTPIAQALAEAGEDLAGLEVAALRQRIGRLQRRSRAEPLGSAPAQLFLARLEAQGRDLRHLAYGIQFGLPPHTRVQGLATP